MMIREIVDELRVVQAEFVIAAYCHERYEIEVYTNVRDCIDSINRHKQNVNCVDEVRLEVKAEWRGKSASTYHGLAASEFNRLEAIERVIKAKIKLRLAQHFAGQDYAEKEGSSALGTQLAHKNEKASPTACL